MSMMMPPDPSAAPGLAPAPGGGGAPGPMDALNQGPVPAGPGGMGALMAALGGGGGGGPGGGPGLGPGPDPGLQGGPDDIPVSQMSPTDHIQAAMQHLMMALAIEPDEQTGQGIVKGMGALQSILGGAQKKQSQLAQLGG